MSHLDQWRREYELLRIELGNHAAFYLSMEAQQDERRNDVQTR